MTVNSIQEPLLFYFLLFFVSSFSQVETIDYDAENRARYLGATKLCWDYDYEKAFGQKRVMTVNRTEFVDDQPKTYEDNCCTAFIPAPFVSPLEYYFHEFENDKPITKNRTNVFKLRDIRSQLYKDEHVSFRNRVNAIDTENMVSLTMALASIQDYDFSTNKLRLSYSLLNRGKIGHNSKAIIIPRIGSDNWSQQTHYISVSEDRAKEIYDYYNQTKLNKNPPFRLGTKTTYAMRIPKGEQIRPYPFECVLKKIEFFLKKEQLIDPELKIGELLFDETIYTDKRNRKYQMPIKH